MCCVSIVEEEEESDLYASVSKCSNCSFGDETMSQFSYTETPRYAFYCSSCPQYHSKHLLFTWSDCKHKYSNRCARTIAYTQLLCKKQPYCVIPNCSTLLNQQDALHILNSQEFMKFVEVYSLFSENDAKSPSQSNTREMEAKEHEESKSHSVVCFLSLSFSLCAVDVQLPPPHHHRLTFAFALFSFAGKTHTLFCRRKDKTFHYSPVCQSEEIHYPTFYSHIERR